jgi:hypothetical protein
MANETYTSKVTVHNVLVMHYRRSVNQNAELSATHSTEDQLLCPSPKSSQG